MTKTIEIRPDNDIATLINVFVVEPDKQKKLIQVLKEGAETLMSKQPGYISASFHKSRDGRRVVNYAQWRSPIDIEAFRSKPEIGEYSSVSKSWHSSSRLFAKSPTSITYNG